jgi:hypothetical protein
MVFVKATADSEAGAPPLPGLLDAMEQFNADLSAAGILEGFGEGLKPSSEAVRIRFDRAERIVTHGPFQPAEALVAGFWLWRVRDLDEAISWAQRCPNPMPGPSDIEIRPIYSEQDFAELVGREPTAPA